MPILKILPDAVDSTANYVFGNVTTNSLTVGGTNVQSVLIINQGIDATQNTRLNAIETINTDQNTNITVADTKAQAAFDKANSANVLAQAAYNQANTGGGGTLDQFARDTANSASSNTIIIQGVNDGQNTTITAVNQFAQAAYNQANTGGGGTLDQYARDTANSASSNTVIIQGVDNTQNTRLGSIETINTDQNTSISIIQGVDSTQNTRLSSIETININQNTNIQTVFDKANTAPKTTTSTAAPSSPNVGDMWYDTDYDVLLRYTYDGTANNWIDITGPIIRSTYIRPTYLISANVS